MGVIITLIGAVLFYSLGMSLNELLLVLLGLILLILFIWFNVFGNYKHKIQKDLKHDVKITEAATVQKIKKDKDRQNYILSNGLKISDGDFEAESIEINSIGIGQVLIITYTPHRKMILQMNLKKKYGT